MNRPERQTGDGVLETGVAEVPGIGFITLTIVLEALGIPLEGLALILGVERILDMTRTAINVTGDSACAIWVAHTEGELHVPEVEPEHGKASPKKKARDGQDLVS